ncbi:MAG: helicase, partial [Deltaproteobacteria bacterium]|nr:helicase [Deltaproteobacteria bacterium]
VMTIYRRRLASSFRALGSTLQRHLDAVTVGRTLTTLDEDAPDDETLDEAPDTEEMVAMEQQVLAAEETDDIQSLLDSIRRLPPDSKLASLRQALDSLRADGYRQIMVFTQYTDTMDFLREELGKDPNLRLLCFSGRGGEVPPTHGGGGGGGGAPPPTPGGGWGGAPRGGGRRRA